MDSITSELTLEEFISSHSLQCDFNDEFFGKLWQNGTHVNFTTTTPGKGGRPTQWTSPEEIDYPLADDEVNIYFGVHPQKAIPETESGREASVRSRKTNTEVVNCLFGEFDSKDFGDSKEEALDHIKSLEFAPSVINDSGNGYHCFWLLDRPFKIQNDEDLSRADEIQKAWVSFIGSDEGAKDLARMLRVVGSYNAKGEKPIEVINVEYDFDRLYSLEKLEKASSGSLAKVKTKTSDGSGFVADRRYLIPDLSGFVKGHRNDSLFKYGSRLRGQRYEESMIRKLLHTVGKASSPPMDDAEIETIARSVMDLEEGSKKTTFYGPQREQRIWIGRALGLEFSQNDMTGEWLVNGDPIDEFSEAHIKTVLRDSGYPQVNVFLDAFRAYAGTRGFHPVKEFIESEEWNGEDHIGKLVSHFEDQHHKIFPFLFKRWIVSAVRKVYESGYHNRVLVLDGDQGIGKSFFVRWLVGAERQLHYEGTINLKDKDHKLRRLEKLVWEISEMGFVTGIEGYKDFLTNEWTTERRAYGRGTNPRPNVASFIASVNDVDGFLDDPTGSRRFMATTITYINWRYTEISQAQLWAQALALYRAGEPGDLTIEEEYKVNEALASYERSTAAEMRFKKLIEVTDDSGDFVTLDELVEAFEKKHLGVDPEKTKKSIGRAMAWITRREYGVRKTRKRIVEETRIYHQRGWTGLRLK